jgi:opacity protein-like surface antigen
MKFTTQIVGSIGMAILLSAASSQGQDFPDNWYVHTDLGPAFIPNANLHFRANDMLGNSFRGTGRFQADPGIRGDLAFGYNFADCLAFELETGALWNPGPGRSDCFYQIPVLLNMIGQVPITKSWNFYLGAGAGAVISINQSEFHDPSFHTPFALEDSDATLGYQVETGFKYTLSKHVELDLGYKFLGVDQYNYTFRLGNTFVAHARVNDLYTHSAQLSVTWKF